MALQVSFVEVCVALDRLKPAARAVRQLQLAAEFPTVEALYRQRSLARLMNKRLWPVALSYAGSDVSLQVIAGAVGRLTEPDTAGQPQTAPRKQPSKLQPGPSMRWLVAGIFCLIDKYQSVPCFKYIK